MCDARRIYRDMNKAFNRKKPIPKILLGFGYGLLLILILSTSGFIGMLKGISFFIKHFTNLLNFLLDFQMKIFTGGK